MSYLRKLVPDGAGIQVEKLDSRLRGNDKNQYPQQELITKVNDD